MRISISAFKLARLTWYPVVAHGPDEESASRCFSFRPELTDTEYTKRRDVDINVVWEDVLSMLTLASFCGGHQQSWTILPSF